MPCHARDKDPVTSGSSLQLGRRFEQNRNAYPVTINIRRQFENLLALIAGSVVLKRSRMLDLISSSVKIGFCRSDGHASSVLMRNCGPLFHLSPKTDRVDFAT